MDRRSGQVKPRQPGVAVAGELEIFPLLLAELSLPKGHPEARGDGPHGCIVQGFAVRDGDEIVLVDTGVGEHPAIERAYAPRRRSLDDALAAAGRA